MAKELFIPKAMLREISDIITQQPATGLMGRSFLYGAQIDPEKVASVKLVVKSAYFEVTEKEDDNAQPAQP